MFDVRTIVFLNVTLHQEFNKQLLHVIGITPIIQLMIISVLYAYISMYIYLYIYFMTVGH